MLSSTLTWLDHDASARERSLRVLALFSERDTVDELGLGAIRDTLAEALFPGTSTIQTRLRYMLIVPWVYRLIEDEIGSNRRDVEAVGARAAELEFRIVDALRQRGDEIGVFGIAAGRRLRRLPSSVYWAGLESWGLRVVPLTQAQYHRHVGALVERRKRVARAGMEGDDVGRDDAAISWHPAIPPAPPGFPDELDLTVTAAEAEFLLDRVRQRHPASLLAHLIEGCRPAECEYPWEHPERAGFSAAQRELLHHAERLSLVAHGAFLFYNVALAEQKRAENVIDARLGELAVWEQSVPRVLLADWDLDRLWALVADGPFRVTPLARAFVAQWRERIVTADGNVRRLRGDDEARRLIRQRESQLKGARSRFSNPQALEQWGGRSGGGRYRFRWSTVSRFHRDMHAALAGREAV